MVVAVVHGEHPQSRIPNVPIYVDCASPAGSGELHVVASDSNWDVWHTLRHPDGTWEPFGLVATQVPGFRGEVRRMR